MGTEINGSFKFQYLRVQILASSSLCVCDVCECDVHIYVWYVCVCVCVVCICGTCVWCMCVTCLSCLIVYVYIKHRLYVIVSRSFGEYTLSLLASGWVSFPTASSKRVTNISFPKQFCTSQQSALKHQRVSMLVCAIMKLSQEKVARSTSAT